MEHHVAPRSLVRGATGWAISLVLAVPAGLVLHEAGLDAETWLLGVALSTTALGTLVPILADAGLLPTRLGAAVLGTGVARESWLIVVISIFLNGATARSPRHSSCLPSARSSSSQRRRRCVPAPRAWFASSSRPCTPRARPRSACTLTLVALALLALEVGLDFVLGAFAGGLVVGLALDSPDALPARMRLEGVGFGFPIPIYFVVTGMTFDLDSLLMPTGLGLAALFLALFIVIRGTPSLLWLGALGPWRTASLALFERHPVSPSSWRSWVSERKAARSPRGCLHLDRSAPECVGLRPAAARHRDRGPAPSRRGDVASTSPT